MILGTKYILNQGLPPSDSLVGNLQTEYNAKINSSNLVFINGGENKQTNTELIKNSISKIAEIKPEYTVLVTGAPSELIADCLYDLNFIVRFCPYEKIKTANPVEYSEFLSSYISSVKQIKAAAENNKSKFIVLFLGPALKRSHLIEALGVCRFLSGRLGPLGVSTDLIIQEMTVNNINVLHSAFFGKIILQNGKVDVNGEFSPKANKLLAKQISFWLFPELRND